MKLQVNDYVVVGSPKKAFLQVTHVDADEQLFEARVPRKESTVETYKYSDLIAALGPNPPKGTVFGCNTERFYRSSESDFGTVDWYYKPDKETRKIVTNSLSKIWGKLVGLDAHHFAPISVEVRLPRGKYAGSYRYTSSEEKLDILTLHPNEEMLTTQMDYVVAHECGHGVWYNMLSDSIHAQWIDLYEKAVKVEKVSDKDLKFVVSRMTPDDSNGGLVSAVRGQLDEGHVAIFDELVYHASQYHNLSLDELDVLSKEGYDVTKFFPGHAHISDIEATITEYGGTNVREFFAEAFAYHVVGMKLPKSVMPMVKNTLAYIKRSYG